MKNKFFITGILSIILVFVSTIVCYSQQTREIRAVFDCAAYTNSGSRMPYTGTLTLYNDGTCTFFDDQEGRDFPPGIKRYEFTEHQLRIQGTLLNGVPFESAYVVIPDVSRPGTYKTLWQYFNRGGEMRLAHIFDSLGGVAPNDNPSNYGIMVRRN